MCSCCGNIKTDLKLSDREYVCDNCGLVINRDENAAINIGNEGIRLYNELIGQRMSEYKLVEHPTMDDKEEIPLKSSGVMKQEDVLT